MAMNEAAENESESDPAKRIANVNNAFRKTGGTFGRLQPKDQARIKARNAALIKLLSETPQN
jgi:hypothetical protein